MKVKCIKRYSDICLKEIVEKGTVLEVTENRGAHLISEGVDNAMKATGLKRTECQDVPDPSGMKHKQMRYEGIIDMESDEVYWT